MSEKKWTTIRPALKQPPEPAIQSFVVQNNAPCFYELAHPDSATGLVYLALPEHGFSWSSAAVSFGDASYTSPVPMVVSGCAHAALLSALDLALCACFPNIHYSKSYA